MRFQHNSVVPLPKRVYTDLAQYFDLSGDTQTDFARRLGVNQGYISKVANKLMEPSLEMAVLIAREANIPVESLLMETNTARAHAGGEGA